MTEVKAVYSVGVERNVKFRIDYWCMNCGHWLGIVHHSGGRSYLRAWDDSMILDGEVTCPVCGGVQRFVSCRKVE